MYTSQGCICVSVTYNYHNFFTYYSFFLFQEKAVVRKTLTDLLENLLAHSSETLKQAFEIWLHLAWQVIMKDGSYYHWIVCCFCFHHAVLQAVLMYPERQSIQKQNLIDWFSKYCLRTYRMQLIVLNIEDIVINKKETAPDL